VVIPAIRHMLCMSDRGFRYNRLLKKQGVVPRTAAPWASAIPLLGSAKKKAGLPLTYSVATRPSHKDPLAFRPRLATGVAVALPSEPTYDSHE